MSSEITPRKFIFPRKSLGIFRWNSEETNFRGNSEDHQFVGKLLGIYRGRTSSRYFDGLSDVQSSEVPTKCSSEFSSGISEERSPRKIPRNVSLGKFRGTGPSEYSEERVPRNIPRNESLDVMAVGNPTMQRMLSERRAALGLPVRDPEESDPNRQQPSNPTNYFEGLPAELRRNQPFVTQRVEIKLWKARIEASERIFTFLSNQTTFRLSIARISDLFFS
ncbi:hypothetical protein F2Q70_00044360 [Brassica cretica]|uniref:Uncharacterized protein n=1 Tax=Brassica cretica TaxID=69181 RepID=A0A8S9KCS8_BRACR|nr:hypothetical protein F2Q70_00044360 [Brassica cretica]